MKARAGHADWTEERRQPRPGPVAVGPTPSLAIPEDEIRLATEILVQAAMTWADRDYGDTGELEADAALNDAVREFRRVADLFDGSPLDVFFERIAR